jgi:hypothetical protein
LFEVVKPPQPFFRYSHSSAGLLSKVVSVAIHSFGRLLLNALIERDRCESSGWSCCPSSLYSPTISTRGILSTVSIDHHVSTSLYPISTLLKTQNAFNKTNLRGSGSGNHCVSASSTAKVKQSSGLILRPSSKTTRRDRSPSRPNRY